MSTLEVDMSPSGTSPYPSVRLRGELDISTAPRVEQAMREAEEGRPEVVVMDLRDLTFMDSTGLRVILEADTRARGDERRLVLIPGPMEVQRVFQVTDLDTRLEFADDPDEVSGSRGGTGD